MKHYWFKRKRHGYGWVPSRWQGWVVVILYIILILLGASFLGSDQPMNENIIVFATVFVVSTGVLLSITHYKAPRPKWRWGTEPTDNPNEDA